MKEIKTHLQLQRMWKMRDGSYWNPTATIFFNLIDGALVFAGAWERWNKVELTPFEIDKARGHFEL